MNDLSEMESEPPEPTESRAYFLSDDGAVASRLVPSEELAAARKTATEKLEANPSGWAMRSCWVCNPAHAHFLEDLTDGFLFQCVMGCGHWYYQGIDLSGGPHETD
jgi:hypothetical protein